MGEVATGQDGAVDAGGLGAGNPIEVSGAALGAAHGDAIGHILDGLADGHSGSFAYEEAPR